MAWTFELTSQAKISQLTKKKNIIKGKTRFDTIISIFVITLVTFFYYPITFFLLSGRNEDI